MKAEKTELSNLATRLTILETKLKEREKVHNQEISKIFKAKKDMQEERKLMNQSWDDLEKWGIMVPTDQTTQTDPIPTYTKEVQTEDPIPTQTKDTTRTVEPINQTAQTDPKKIVQNKQAAQKDPILMEQKTHQIAQTKIKSY